jgi:hypothetical protein
MLPLNLYARVRIFYVHLHARPRVQRAPGFPCALYSTEGERLCNTRASHAARMRTHTPRCLTVKSEYAAIAFRSVAGSYIQRRVCFAPDLAHRAIAIPDLDAAIRALRLNRRKKIAGRCRFPKTPFVVPTPGR